MRLQPIFVKKLYLKGKLKMDVIKEARNLGKAIQSDPRFLRYAKARLANDDNSELQDAIGNFNLVRM